MNGKTFVASAVLALVVVWAVARVTGDPTSGLQAGAAAGLAFCVVIVLAQVVAALLRKAVRP